MTTDPGASPAIALVPQDRGGGDSQSTGLKGSDTPHGLNAAGAALWASVTAAHDLDGGQRAVLEEACRAKDRLDRLDSQLSREMDLVLLADANKTAQTMKQLIASLRLPDVRTGRRPQYRGARGAYVMGRRS